MKNRKEAIREARSLLRFCADEQGGINEDRVRQVVHSLRKSQPRNHADILEVFQNRLRLEMEKSYAVVESAKPLTESERAEIEQSLAKKYGPATRADYVVNPELVGGVVIRVGDDVLDGSIRTRLQKLEEAFS